jgi:hypothetical protein
MIATDIHPGEGTMHQFSTIECMDGWEKKSPSFGGGGAR